MLATIVLPFLITALLTSPTPNRRTGVRTIGVDFGLRRCGVAISSGFAPLPLSVLPCNGDSEAGFEEVAHAVAKVAAGEGATQVVLGMPYNSSGGEGEQANITRVFASKLADAVHPRPVFLWDERFSSAEASSRMNRGRGASRGERLDAVAAAIILEDFFDADEAACAVAPHIASSRSEGVDVGTVQRPRVRKLPIPPSQAEVRRAMMERAAETQPSGRAGEAGRGDPQGKRRADPSRTMGARSTDRFRID